MDDPEPRRLPTGTDENRKFRSFRRQVAVHSMELGDKAYFVSAGLVAPRARTPSHRRDHAIFAAAAGEDTGTAGAGREDQQQRDLAAGEGAAEPEVGDDETAGEGP